MKRPRAETAPTGDYAAPVRLFLIARHGQSTLNVEQRVNGDPAVRVDLTEEGRANARGLGEQIANIPIGLCIHTRFDRTRQTAQLALEGRDVHTRWSRCSTTSTSAISRGRRSRTTAHGRAGTHGRISFRAETSLDDAGRRYVEAYRKLVERETPEVVLIVCHEIPMRYALNAGAGSDDLDGPMHEVRNATPYLFDEPILHAAERIEQLAG